MKQQSFSSLEQAHKNKRAKREVFLDEMDAVVASTKNEASKRDPDMSQSKKGNQWYFGPPLVVCRQTTAGQWKSHIGVDVKSGLAHRVKITTGKAHDAKMTDDLIRADDVIVFG